MTKLEHLKRSGELLKKIVRCRRKIGRKGTGKKTTERMISTMAIIEHFLPEIKSFDRMQAWISRNGFRSNVEELIPSNKQIWMKELNELVREGDFLQGRTVRKNEIIFNQ